MLCGSRRSETSGTEENGHQRSSLPVPGAETRFKFHTGWHLGSTTQTLL